MRRVAPVPSRLALMIASLFPLVSVPAAWAADGPAELSEVAVSASRVEPLRGGQGVERSWIARQRAATSDSAALLLGVPGAAMSTAGGVSSLPVIQGLADDRNRIQVDGMDLISACGNHMNPPLSYIDPTRIGEIQVYSGVRPVSLGGDSIGATVVVDSRAPRFAVAGEGNLTTGEVGAFYRSNGDAHGFNATATWASENLSVTYAGSEAESRNYRSAKDFKSGTTALSTRVGDHWIAGDEVASSAYKSINQALDVALRNGNHLFEVKAGVQHIPYQGFPNQHMDMTDNKSARFAFNYTGTFEWGSLQGRIYQEQTRHQMDFGKDKLYWYGAAKNVAGMPMDTKGNNIGAQLKAEINLNERDTLRVGTEYQRYRLDDWWSPVANSMMMSPNTFSNINDGQRDRFDVYGEWEAQWTPRWTSLAGLRSSTLRMNAGTVQGYNTMAMMYGADAARFNAADRRKTDDNVDATLMLRFTPAVGRVFEGGYSRKTRSPSLYERYTWSTNGMAMTMNNWLNDGNGYVGDVALKPEVAHTVSVSADFRDVEQQRWAFKVTPYYSYIDNYIDARCLTTCTAQRFNYLKLVNTDARIAGIDLSGQVLLAEGAGFGSVTGKAVVGYVRGKDARTDDHLYNIMPLNARLTVEHRVNAWINSVEGVFVKAKDDVSQVRNEIRTAGYGLLNLRSSYDQKHYRVDLGLDNAFNKQYALPLGGAYIGQGTTMALNGAGAPYGIGVPGMGRSLYAGLTLKF